MRKTFTLRGLKGKLIMSQNTMDDFDKLFPGLSEKIFEQFYGDADHGILIWNREQLDREGFNHTFCAEIILHGQHIYVSCQDGNWNGSEILDFECCKLDNHQENICPYCGGQIETIIGNFKICQKCEDC